MRSSATTKDYEDTPSAQHRQAILVLSVAKVFDIYSIMSWAWGNLGRNLMHRDEISGSLHRK